MTAPDERPFRVTAPVPIVATYSQRCARCGIELLGTVIRCTTRGWMHDRCVDEQLADEAARTLREEAKRVEATPPIVYHGTQRELILALQERGQLAWIQYDKNGRRDRRYSWVFVGD